MDTNMDKYLGTMLDDRYEILEVIGTGGMAVVYKAMCHRLNRYVAVKILRDELANDEEFRKRFQTEAQAVAMLSHPNIVSVYDVSHSDGVEYIVMELIEGVTLMQYMKKKGALGWKEALHFAVQISKALEHAHEKGIVHRDIKPQNIMILKDGTIKVADFGIAALESAQEKKSDQTVGSVHYIAPEQARGEQPPQLQVLLPQRLHLLQRLARGARVADLRKEKLPRRDGEILADGEKLAHRRQRLARGDVVHIAAAVPQIVTHLVFRNALLQAQLRDPLPRVLRVVQMRRPLPAAHCTAVPRPGSRFIYFEFVDKTFQIRYPRF